MLYVITELRVFFNVFQGKVGLTGPVGPPGQKVGLFSSLLLMQ